MSISALAVQHFRNLEQVDLQTGSGINVVFGANAAGKTSLLEAIHFLARARSFRSTRSEQLITRGQQALLVRGTVAQRDGTLVKVGVQRGADETRVRINGEDVRSLSALARYFPLQVINAESQRLLLDGPKVRRSFLNWSLFHVEHDYYAEWRRFDRALRQRNAALKAGDPRLARAWDSEFIGAGSAIDRMRRPFVEALATAGAPLLAEWLGEEDVQLGYRAGWAHGRELGEAIEEGRARELDAGYSLFGPHRGDLVFRAGAMEAQHRLSRGQQKLLVIAVLLAQTQLLNEQSGQQSILLVDDLPAELDLQRRGRVLELLLTSGAQAFITCTDRDALPLAPDQAQWFHVEHGKYREVI